MCSRLDDRAKKEIVMIYTIYKSGITKECRNYRTIALLSPANKILLVFMKRITGKIEYEGRREEGKKGSRVTEAYMPTLTDLP